ncbi:hypothetical protein XFF6994_4470017 [Xanthomonas citri pv. fuscans]|nr:hypothetical protein XFF7766_1120036 [Xanthomonas citri pv. fuscans]SOO34680.1 hypothetical protein XFF6994_4470017 [Xanthomonas citri pv. fuscans]SOO43242.1 hypothetical protein XFF1815_330078 [Xanthomonas citri pv. fuscans]
MLHDVDARLARLATVLAANAPAPS